MSEPMENIEARLSRLQLRSVSAGLGQRIGRELDGDRDKASTSKSACLCRPDSEKTATDKSTRPRHSDRWLWSAITSGAIATCVIIAVWVGDARSSTPAAQLPLTQHAEPTMSSSPALASAAQSWGDELGPDLYGSHP